MQLLDACLALALTLALFASSATVLVELLQRLFRTRVKQLRAMLGVVFDRHLAGLLAAAGADVATLRAGFVEAVGQRDGARRMRATAGQPARAPTAVEQESAKPMAVECVTVEDMLCRLARNEDFRQVFADLEEGTLRPALEALAAGFRRLEADANALFAARARMLAYGCGICLAVAVNVDAVRLFNHYARNPAETAQTIAALAAARPATAGKDDKAEQQIAATIDELHSLSAVGVPVGPGFFPHCSPPAEQGQFDARCKKPPTGWAYFGHFAFWLICVLVTGFLIGLGGPYWFDIATSLGQWRDLLRGLAGRSGTPPAAAAPAAVPPAPTFQDWIDELAALAKPAPASTKPIR